MLPNFFILGTAKAGTTSLAHYLKQHPQVFIPQNKEPNFFILEGADLPPYGGPANSETLYEIIYKCSVTDFSHYQSLFDGVTQETAIGDATVLYLYFAEAADRIRQQVPEARMIIMLRNPVDRLYSHYLMVKQAYGLEPLDLIEALEQEESRIEQNWGWDWHYSKLGLYSSQIKYYFERFDPSQFKIVLYEEYCENPLKVVKEIFRHLGVDDKFTPDLSQRSKVATGVRSIWLRRILNHPSPLRSQVQRLMPNSAFLKLVNLGNRINQETPKPMSTELRYRLQHQFKPDILRLQDLIHRDLSQWLEPPAPEVSHA